MRALAVGSWTRTCVTHVRTFYERLGLAGAPTRAKTRALDVLATEARPLPNPSTDAPHVLATCGDAACSPFAGCARPPRPLRMQSAAPTAGGRKRRLPTGSHPVGPSTPLPSARGLARPLPEQCTFYLPTLDEFERDDPRVQTMFECTHTRALDAQRQLNERLMRTTRALADRGKRLESRVESDLTATRALQSELDKVRHDASLLKQQMLDATRQLHEATHALQQLSGQLQEQRRESMAWKELATDMRDTIDRAVASYEVTASVQLKVNMLYEMALQEHGQ